MRLVMNLLPVPVFLLLNLSPALGEVECKKLDHSDCISSQDCIIDRAEGGERYAYVCRARRAPCETALPADRKLRAAECEKRVGCSMQGDCYCPCNDKLHSLYGSCNCACGGGLPPDCRPEQPDR